MNRVIVIGASGSGKSTFSRALAKITGLPLYHLDLMFWNADKTTVEKEVFLKRLTKVLKTEKWIIDGNFSSSMELRMQECDTVIFLDYPTEVCLEGVRARRGKERPDMPWIETEEDPEFMDFIRDYKNRSRPLVLELIKKYSNKKVIVFKNRSEAEDFLKAL